MMTVEARRMASRMLAVAVAAMAAFWVEAAPASKMKVKMADMYVAKAEKDFARFGTKSMTKNSTREARQRLDDLLKASADDPDVVALDERLKKVEGAFNAEGLEEGYLAAIAVKVVGRLEVERKAPEPRIVDDAREGLLADLPLADAGVAVLVRGEGVERVVEVDGLESVEADHAVELVQDAVEVADDVVAAVPHVACVEAYAEPVRGRARGGESALHAVDDRAQLLEVAPNLRALARHGLKEDRRGERRGEAGEDADEHI